MSRGSDVGGDLLVPVPPEVAARVLEAHPDYFVVRRVGPMVRPHGPAASAAELTVAVVDCETTGLDLRGDRIIELAIQRIRVDADGRIVETGRPRNWLEDPGTPIPVEVTAVTGISDADVAGRSIAEGEAHCMLVDADLVLAHNARFDRAFVDRRLSLPPVPWVCSLDGLDWRAHGFDARTLTSLLHRCGWFFDAHRASDDVNALLHLLDHRLACGTTVMKELLVSGARPTWRVEAVGAPMSAREALKRRRYRWNPEGRVWWREVPEAEAGIEREWLVESVYAGTRQPRMSRITWRERYALDESEAAE